VATKIAHAAAAEPIVGTTGTELSLSTTKPSTSLAADASVFTAKKINLSTVFAGQAVGIKEVEEGIWLVTFMDYDLGYIELGDLQRRRLCRACRAV
jgi:hypothetical protein